VKTIKPIRQKSQETRIQNLLTGNSLCETRRQLGARCKLWHRRWEHLQYY